MDPWSMVDYSWIIREASMVEDKLPEVDPPSASVPRRSLLALPILEARHRRKRGEIAKKGSVFGSFTSRGIYRRRGQPGGAPGAQAASWRGHPLGRATRAPGAGPLAPLWLFRKLQVR